MVFKRYTEAHYNFLKFICMNVDSNWAGSNQKCLECSTSRNFEKGFCRADTKAKEGNYFIGCSLSGCHLPSPTHHCPGFWFSGARNVSNEFPGNAAAAAAAAAAAGPHWEIHQSSVISAGGCGSSEEQCPAFKQGGRKRGGLGHSKYI